jgi:hypothetical protein
MESTDEEESDEDVRRELEDARANVLTQIDVLNRSRYARAGGYGGDNLALAALNKTLAELEEALADLGPDDA